jgi:3-hydroxyacyl-[acyl-carrier-protein] dehydratase
MTPRASAYGEAGDATAATGLSFDRIRRLLPHQEPFVLIDRVLSLEPNRRIVCLKNVSGGEPIFASHFPERAIFPGVLILEAMAQAALLLFLRGTPPAEPDGRDVRVLAAARARWLRPVRPGDQLIVSVAMEKATAVAALVSCQATVRGRPIAQARLTLGTARIAE